LKSSFGLEFSRKTDDDSRFFFFVTKSCICLFVAVSYEAYMKIFCYTDFSLLLILWIFILFIKKGILNFLYVDILQYAKNVFNIEVYIHNT